MDATGLIIKEHRLIGRVADAFESYVNQVNQQVDPIDRHDLGRFVTFFREYADLGHHEKEESLLLPALVESGLSWDDGVISAIRHEHNQERYLMRTLKQAAMQKDLWSQEDHRHLLSLGRTFIEFLRQHAKKEEEQVLPLLEARLSARAAEHLSEQLEHFDEVWAASGESTWLKALAQELITRYARQA
jgi:hemerythrin-like domain-containing protein